MIKTEFYDKSPLNYIGGKYRILPQIFERFPSKIERFVDLFCGGLDVSANVKAKSVYCNDINYHVIDIYRAFKKLAVDELLNYIDDVIRKYGLTQTNQEGYLALRKHYNETRQPLDLYVLVCFSFNYQFRFNSKHEYNNPFGRERSSFNPVMRNNLIKFHKNISQFNFAAQNFKVYDCSFLTRRDFLYADPPYRIALGSYNDGKRGFEGWTLDDDLILFELLDSLNARKIKFALSNVVEHKGEINEILAEWMRKYNVHYISGNYDNSNYRSTARRNKTTEILVTNY